MAASENDDEMRTRLAKLTTSLGGTTPAAKPLPTSSEAPQGLGQAVNLGMRVMSEFVASVVVGGVIGWAIDHWFGTSPGALIIFVGLGTAAGFWSVYRLATQSTKPLGR